MGVGVGKHELLHFSLLLLLSLPLLAEGRRIGIVDLAFPTTRLTTA
jgi:hypothetical protein